MVRALRRSLAVVELATTVFPSIALIKAFEWWRSPQGLDNSPTASLPTHDDLAIIASSGLLVALLVLGARVTWRAGQRDALDG